MRPLHVCCLFVLPGDDSNVHYFVQSEAGYRLPYRGMMMLRGSACVWSVMAPRRGFEPKLQYPKYCVLPITLTGNER